MRCPFCGEEDTQVKDSRASEDGATIRRRRLCSSCGSRFTTFERIQLRDLIVIKRNGKKNPFDRDKLSKSLLMALRKRQTDDDAIERAINGIVRQLESRGDNDIHSKLIGELVMNALAQIDNVAYIRYASVYRNFREASDFGKFVEKGSGNPTDVNAKPKTGTTYDTGKNGKFTWVGAMWVDDQQQPAPKDVQGILTQKARDEGDTQ